MVGAGPPSMSSLLSQPAGPSSLPGEEISSLALHDSSNLFVWLSSFLMFPCWNLTSMCYSFTQFLLQANEFMESFRGPQPNFEGAWREANQIQILPPHQMPMRGPLAENLDFGEAAHFEQFEKIYGHEPQLAQPGALPFEEGGLPPLKNRENSGVSPIVSLFPVFLKKIKNFPSSPLISSYFLLFPAQKVLSETLHGFFNSVRQGQAPIIGPLPNLGLSEADKWRIRDRASILGRHVFSNRGEGFADSQVGENLLLFKP